VPEGAPTDLAREIVAGCHVLQGEGLVGAYGHVSARSPGGGEFLISGRRSMAAMTIDDVRIITIDDDPPIAPGVPLEAYIHSAIYAMRPDVMAVARSHGDACSVFGILDKPVRPVHDFGATAGAHVGVLSSAELVTSASKGKAVAKALGDDAALILRGNGVVVTGASVAEACVRSIYLEESARLQALAWNSGRELIYLGSDEIHLARRDVGSAGQVDRSWQHFRRLHDHQQRHQPHEGHVMVQYQNPTSLPAPLGLYSHIAEDPATGLVCIAGQLPVGSTGATVGTEMSEQLAVVFEHVGGALQAVGLTYEHILQMTTYLTARSSIEPFFAARAALFPKLFGAAPYPPNTLAIIDGLVLPDALVEVQVMATRASAAGGSVQEA
jgi:HCOMODA/2-hydroxy-3-carboxy-muconic semialdehyde decarboxylase